jgi:hypothetical protein
LKGRASTVDLLEKTSSDQLLLILQTFICFLTKQATLMRRSTILSLPLQLVFPGPMHRDHGVFLAVRDGGRFENKFRIAHSAAYEHYGVVML